jgi:hypothetical protein
MWNLLKKADIDVAKSELALRRAATLRKQAEESETLEINRAELERLNKLIDAFLQKFPRPPIVSHAPVAPPVVHHPVAAKPGHEAKSAHEAKPAHEAKHHSHHRHQTVFATYMRAASRV